SAKLEQAACHPMSDILLKDWCLKRLQHLTVLALEFCNQQQDQNQWQQQANNLIESHVALMRSLNWNEAGKHDQGLRH
ncbi:TPA: transcriptional regulator, partial [Vibrio parahaemolyticus]